MLADWMAELYGSNDDGRLRLLPMKMVRVIRNCETSIRIDDDLV